MVNSFIELVRLHQRPQMNVAEIGVWSGESFIYWAPIVERNHGSCLLVDNFMGNPTAVGIHEASAVRRDDVAMLLKQRMEEFSNVVLIEGDSAESASAILDGSLDVCFIDADHRYSRVRLDILAWLPKVRPGGILCGHDCESWEHDERFIETDFRNGKHHGVIKAVNELIPDHTLLRDACWCYSVPQTDCTIK